MKLALASDTMLGRGVAERLAQVPPTALFADGVVAAAREADLFIETEEAEGEGQAVLSPLEADEVAEGDEAEVALDEILRQRFEGDEELEARVVTPSEEEVRPRTAEEFVCQSCFLVKHCSQLVDARRSLCRDCVNSAGT